MSDETQESRPFGGWFRDGYETEEEAFTMYQHKLATFFASRGHENSDELVSDVFFELLRKWTPQLGAECAEPIRYLFGIAKNVAMRRQRVEQSLDDVTERADPPRPERASDDLTRCLEESLAELTPEDRNLVENYKFGRESISTLAGTLGIAEGALRARIFRIVRQLQKKIRECEHRRRSGHNRSIQ